MNKNRRPFLSLLWVVPPNSVNHLMYACFVSWGTQREKRVNGSDNHQLQNTHTHTQGYLWSWGLILYCTRNHLHIWLFNIWDLSYVSLSFPITSLKKYLLNKCTIFTHLKVNKYVSCSFQWSRKVFKFLLSRFLSVTIPNFYHSL